MPFVMLKEKHRAQGALLQDYGDLRFLAALGRSCELRDGSGIGVGEPQFSPRRGIYLSLQKDF